MGQELPEPSIFVFLPNKKKKKKKKKYKVRLFLGHTVMSHGICLW